MVGTPISGRADLRPIEGYAEERRAKKKDIHAPLIGKSQARCLFKDERGTFGSTQGWAA